jgi:tRNA U34 5-carboxymethylaminomethyl modifying GTPase MnmE/TrmE
MVTIVLFFAFALLLWLFSQTLLPRYQSWRARSKLLDELEAQYESLRRTRHDLQYHIDWAIDRGERHTAEKLVPELERLDQELTELRTKFETAERGETPKQL